MRQCATKVWSYVPIMVHYTYSYLTDFEKNCTQLGKYSCNSGLCIFNDLLCNGQNDCKDEKDAEETVEFCKGLYLCQFFKFFKMGKQTKETLISFGCFLSTCYYCMWKFWTSTCVYFLNPSWNSLNKSDLAKKPTINSILKYF